MNTALDNALNETKRDALVSYYLQHVIPHRGLGAIAAKITTADDLYEYLLLDPQVSGQIKTSRIAEAIASTQLYVHRCREQLEPGVDAAAMQEASRPGRYLDHWDTYNKRYATWAGLQRLLHYPASYLDPELRYRKTTLFKNLEQTINQGRVTEERVERALRDYMGELRSVLDIRSVSAYQVEPDVSDTPVYFVGHSLDVDGAYYWRYVDSSKSGSGGRVRNPAAWSEWRKIEAPIEPEGDPAIVYFNRRVHVLWLQKRMRDVMVPTAQSAEGGVRAERAQQVFRWELQFATLLANGQWRQRSYLLEDLIDPTVLANPKRLFAAELRGVEGSADPQLGVFLVQQEGNTEVRYLCRFSKLLQHVDSPGKSWGFEFNYGIETPPAFINYPIFQPLKYNPPTGTAPVYTVTVSPSAGVAHGSTVLTGFSLANGVLTFTSDPRVSQIGLIFHTLTQGGGITPVSSTRVPRPPSKTTVSLATTVNQETIASNQGVSITLYLRNTHGGDLEYIRYVVPLVRTQSGGQTPAKLTNFTPGVNLWMVTSPRRLGCSQIFHQRGGAGNDTNEHVMTTLAGPLLEQRMQEGVDVLLSWDTQAILVDPSGRDYGGITINSPLRYEGGVGQYTWELFFHVPFLIANRLLAEQRFDDAERWFKRIFNPVGYRKMDGSLDMIDGKPRYWNVRPLQDDATWNPSSPEHTDDPDLIAAADPMHYKLAVYLRWLELLLARGDHLYRQQNRDSLTEAKMWYVQALQLLGPRPAMPLLLDWADPTLGEASAEGNPSLMLLENLFAAHPSVLAPGLVGQIQVANGPFKAPFNDAVLDYWRRLEQRLYNLRHNRSIDGQPLALPLFEPPVSPTALQQARQAGDGSDPAPSMAGLALWSQRFPLLLERARTAVQQVIQFGASLQGILERRDADALSVLQQTQQGALLGMAKEVHQANLASLEHHLASLRASRVGIEQRRLHYARLYDRHITDNEQRAMDLRTNATGRQDSAAEFRMAAAINMAPNLFIAGMSVGTGGIVLGALTEALGHVKELEAMADNDAANKLDASEQYARRREEWQAARDQSGHEVAQLDEQIQSVTEQISMARKQASQTELEQAYNQVVLDELRTRFSGQTLFNWQAGRLAALYYQFYDLSVGLCARAQRSYQWETRDAAAYLRPGNWSDTYQGLSAGEGLALSLQRLENKYLDWDRRTLEVQRSVSLEDLSKQTLSNAVRDLLNDVGSPTRPEGISVSLENGVLAIGFDLKDMGIGDDYPDALNLGTVRLIKTLSVSLPALLGPYQNVQAVLRYASTEVGVPEGCAAIALSHGLDDNGQFQLDFNDGKYFPFEGVPVHEGTFVLSFPNATTRQRDLLMSLTDVILHVRYTIRQGKLLGMTTPAQTWSKEQE